MSVKSKNALVNTFLELIKEESYDKITVTSLVEKCSISRQTFYYHFNNIEEMLSWAFKSKTDAICEKLVPGKWLDSAELYIDFLNKYDCFFRSAAKGENFIFVFNLLSDSFEKYIRAYFEKCNKKGDNDFIIRCFASSYAGLVIKEIQKEKSDYETLLSEVKHGFRTPLK